MNERTLRVLEFNKIAEKVKNLAASDLGKERAALISPENEYAVVEQLLKETSDAETLILCKGEPPLGGIHDIRRGLKRVQMQAALDPGELLRMADVLGACRKLKNYARDNKDEIDENNMVAGLIQDLYTNRNIEDKINFKIVGENEIADNASTTLKNIRRSIRNFQDSIKDKLNSLVKKSKYRKYMQDAVVTLRGDRYVIPVKQEYRNEFPGLVHDMSSSGATIFIEPASVVETNNNIKQQKLKEQVEIERILSELTQDVAGILPELQKNVDLLSRLDFAFAKGKLSIHYNCIHPKINNNNKIRIKKGRHPLLDTETVVPVDIWVGESFNTLVITGPNTGGKTVTLKTAGLFSLMTQAGLHIPANEGTQMSVYRKIYADIGDEQSIEQSLSTFSSHMSNIIDIIKKTDESSLVLLDELGAGTDPTEGAALAMSVLDRLHEIGATAIATTHYSELKIYALSTEHVENASCEFDVETLKPTYRLLTGVPGKSNAFAISSRLGMPDSIIKKAKEFLTQEDIKFEDMISTIERDRSDAEQERMKAEVYRRENEKIRNDLEEQKQIFKAKKEKYLKDARKEARNILKAAKRDAETILRQMRMIKKEGGQAGGNKAAEKLRLKLKERLDNIENSLTETVMPKKSLVKPPENLKPGDTVMVVNLNKRGTVIKPPDKNGEALIQAGIVKINVHITNLKLVNEQKQVVEKTGTGRISASKSHNISNEIDVRGKILDDAITVTGKYLDDAGLAGLKKVTIIHGKGTGALRKGIQKYLKTNPHVKFFRTGEFGEGQSGVTVVELK